MQGIEGKSNRSDAHELSERSRQQVQGAGLACKHLKVTSLSSGQ